MIEIAASIRAHIALKQKELGLTFEEEAHKYTVLNRYGVPVSPGSVSGKVKKYHHEFEKYAKSLAMCGGDVKEQEKLLKEWDEKARVGAHIGSRCHYYLEHNLLVYYGLNKELREPIYELTPEQIKISDAKIVAGNKYIELMKSRNAVLVDTEVVMGNEFLVGMLDKVWIVLMSDGRVGWFITDWKATKWESFQQQRWSKYMFPPFQNYIDTAVEKYSVQIALYARLFRELLIGSPFYDMPFLGGIIVILKPDETFREIRVAKEFFTLTNQIDLAV